MSTKYVGNRGCSSNGPSCVLRDFYEPFTQICRKYGVGIGALACALGYLRLLPDVAILPRFGTS